MKEIFDTYPLPWSFDDDLAVVVASNGEAVCEFYASGLEDQDALHQVVCQQVNLLTEVK